MRTSDILKKLNIPRHKLYYLEQKGYIKPRRIPMGELEAREYSEEDFKKLELIWKYLQSGFKHKIALQKAMEELQSPKLSLQEQNQKADLARPSPNLTPGPSRSESDHKR
jgi:DNA-binding transcriptional MerR regulator